MNEGQTEEACFNPIALAEMPNHTLTREDTTHNPNIIQKSSNDDTGRGQGAWTEMTLPYFQIVLCTLSSNCP